MKIWKEIINITLNILPILSAIILFSLLPYTSSIMFDCPNSASVTTRHEFLDRNSPESERRGNPLFCKTENWWGLLKNYLHQGRQPYVYYKSYEDSQRWEARNLKIQLDELERLYEQAVSIRNDKKTDTIMANLYDKIIYVLFIEKNNKSDALENMKSEAPLRMAGNEASARVKWIVSYGIQMIVLVFGTLACLFIIFSNMSEFPKAKIWKFFRFSLYSTMFSFSILYAANFIFRSIIFNGVLTMQEPRSGDYFIFANWLAYIDSYLLPGIDRLLAIQSDTIVFSAIVMCASLASILLLSNPEKGLTSDMIAAANANNNSADIQRRFKDYGDQISLRVYQSRGVMFIGSAALVVGVNQVNALYSWPFALIHKSSGITDETISAIASFISNITIGYGFIFSVFLLIIFLPTWFVLRSRTYKVRKLMSMIDGEFRSEAWITERGLHITSDRVTKIIAIFAPTGAAAVASLIDLW